MYRAVTGLMRMLDKRNEFTWALGFGAGELQGLGLRFRIWGGYFLGFGVCVSFGRGAKKGGWRRAQRLEFRAQAAGVDERGSFPKDAWGGV